MYVDGKERSDEVAHPETAVYNLLNVVDDSRSDRESMNISAIGSVM